MSSSFIRKIIYKKERVGIVQKDGKTYVKYVKARRFKVSKNIKYSLLGVLLLGFLSLVAKLLMTELESREPVALTDSDVVN